MFICAIKTKGCQLEDAANEFKIDGGILSNSM